MKEPIPALFHKASTLVDGAVKVEFVSGRELDPDTLATLFAGRGREGWLWFDENQAKPDNTPNTDAKALRGTTPSKRLRQAIHLAWEAQGAQGDFEKDCYIPTMERIITKFEEQLS